MSTSRSEIDRLRYELQRRGMPPPEIDYNIRKYQELKEQELRQAQEQMMQMVRRPGQWVNADFNVGWDESSSKKKVVRDTRSELEDAKQLIQEQNEILERISKEPLILYQIERISKDKKHAYIKKGDTELRIEACKDLAVGDEVLLHPKSLQIVERLGAPPLEASRFSPDKVPDVSWSDIGGLEDAKADMVEAIEMPHKNKDLYKYYNKRPVKGILLSGPPGCGKTMLGKAAANALATIYGKENARTGFLYVKGPEILNMYVGATEQTIREMFRDANRHHEEHGYPAIIFIDEADAILATRGSRNVGIGNTVVPMFLTEMDGLEGSTAIVIIATNRPDVLDPAIVRDGRIDRKVAVTRPGQEQALAIVKMNLARFPAAKNENKDALAAMMVNEIYSDDRLMKAKLWLRDIVNGAMLASCVDLAVSSAIRRDIESGKKSGINSADIIAAVNRMQVQNRNVAHDLEQG